MNAYHDLIYPDAKRPLMLMGEVVAIFAQIPYVAAVYVFGSLARGDGDRWSDIDMIVVVANRYQFREVFNELKRRKTVLHHNPLTLNPAPHGGNVLGIIFQGESVFHCLDLNFLTLDEINTGEAFQRFGDRFGWYDAHHPIPDMPDGVAIADEENADNRRIYGGGIHFTKKAIKNLLRKRGTLEELEPRVSDLKAVTEEYSKDFSVPSGAIGQLAHTYLTIANYLLQEK